MPGGIGPLCSYRGSAAELLDKSDVLGDSLDVEPIRTLTSRSLAVAGRSPDVTDAGVFRLVCHWSTAPLHKPIPVFPQREHSRSKVRGFEP